MKKLTPTKNEVKKNKRNFFYPKMQRLSFRPPFVVQFCMAYAYAKTGAYFEGFIAERMVDDYRAKYGNYQPTDMELRYLAAKLWVAGFLFPVTVPYYVCKTLSK
ncbi:hypothetical protein ISTM_312 [Insectomime virus]|nr:hypothetical protein ISTM_312 [Insectomime virus]